MLRPVLPLSVVLVLSIFRCDDVRAGEETFSQVRSEILAARYMTHGCETSRLDMYGWGRKDIQRCEYFVTDKRSDGSSSKKKGIVYLANPSPEQVFQWLDFACAKAAPRAAKQCIVSSAKSIRHASGAQFPVAGIVWEDMLCNSPADKCVRTKKGEYDGVYEAYLLRNGVTVRVGGFANASTEFLKDSVMKTITIDSALTGIKATGGYARILSTDREAFYRYTRRSDIPVGRGDRGAAEKWMTIVGEEYRKALGSKENRLITASVCKSHGWPKTCGQ